MSGPYPEYPASPQYPQQRASYPPVPTRPAPGGPYPANQAQYQLPPGSPQQVPYPYPAYVRPYYPTARPRPTAAIAWYLGLLVFAWFPGIGAIITSIIMIAVGLSCRKDPEPTRTNGTAAASWGVNYLLATILLVGGHYVALFTVIPDGAPFLPWGLIITTWLLISLFHVIISIVFGVRAGRGKVVPFRGIPFIR